MTAKAGARGKRSARKTRTGDTPRPLRGADARAGRMPNLPNWKWRSFPVFAAFVAGLLLDSIVNPPASDPGTALRIIALLGAGYVIAHVFVVNVIVARRIRSREKAIAAGDDPDAKWVDEVVHPDE